MQVYTFEYFGSKSMILIDRGRGRVRFRLRRSEVLLKRPVIPTGAFSSEGSESGVEGPCVSPFAEVEVSAALRLGTSAESAVGLTRSLCFVALLLWSATGMAAPASSWSVTYQPTRIVNGAPVLFRVTTPKTSRSLSGRWLGHDISFIFDEKKNAWFGLAGTSLETKPGTYPIELNSETAAGSATTYRQTLRVLHHSYPKVLLKVPGKYTAPSPEELAEIAKDKEIKTPILQTVSPEREWQGAFAAPVEAPISEVFGVQRVFNGTVNGTHQGLDFRVHTGTPVAAVNRGKVLLARSLYFEGNCVVLDH